MKKFSELNVGDEFFSECKISSVEIESYLMFSGIRNVIYEKTEFTNQQGKMVSGRAYYQRWKANLQN